MENLFSVFFSVFFQVVKRMRATHLVFSCYFFLLRFSSLYLALSPLIFSLFFDINQKWFSDTILVQKQLCFLCFTRLIFFSSSTVFTSPHIACWWRCRPDNAWFSPLHIRIHSWKTKKRRKKQQLPPFAHE